MLINYCECYLILLKMNNFVINKTIATTLTH